MIETVRALAAELRRVNVPVFTSDVIDAARILEVVPLDDRQTLKLALSTCLAKGADFQDTYGALFDLYFSGDTESPGESLSDATDETLRSLLSIALRHGNRSLLRQIASEAVSRHARIEPGRAVAGTFYIFRTLRGLDVASLREDLASVDDSILDGDLATFAHRLRSTAADRALNDFERVIESEVRRRLVADRGADAVAAVLRTPLPEDTDFLTASASAITRMNDVVEPLARRLSTLLADDSAVTARPRLDVRGTIRGSLSTGGTPVSLRYLPPDPLRPRMVVLADISGSVAAFAAFALQLAYSLRTRFSTLRSFVFVDGVDEVTDMVGTFRSITDTTSRINAEGLGVWLDGHSDYGNTFATFADRHVNALDARTTVLVLGDARNNYRDPRLDALDEIRRASGRVFWLNPERRALWADGDSAMTVYEPHVDGAHECRTIRHLEAFIETLA